MLKFNRLHILLFWAFFLFFLPAAFAQDFLLGGVVFEKGTSNRIAGAEVINKRTGYKVSSSDFGLFQIRAGVGDTLLVIKANFSDAETVVSSNKDILVYLTGGRMLKEVNITGQTKKQELDELKRDYKDKGSFYQGKPPFLSFLFKPLTAVYELFGRTPKNARRFGRYYETELQQTQIDGFFNEFLIQSNTDLKGKDLEKFMLDYRPEYEKAKNWAQYDAIKYIRDSYKKYTDTLKKN
ncbi:MULTISPECIES: hypothetical protein [Pedobacter]|uniref:Uncharacterized protein n=1 Tax=Pedobacter heparinus (strain ATCC 13125 / DSM 2366 / CIP 104194 / JCM 7457 / NBRC 12017 / NCIMB 9290 / NRRL B-14731 / HIM 762-3) TaxID=485917 RepID=C6XX80_PEDHD|nr:MULTISPECIES: hypothetical protein [Pedobacter]ACU06386.1 hypothetical protein Phep_4195 [Pedobacter heparinus DSM 2366]MBB5437244.1 hypothetical protein [Pedobacter sp. AK017]